MNLLAKRYLMLGWNTIIGNMATTNKCCIVSERFTVWIHPILTRYEIKHLLSKRLGIFEPSVHLCAICKSLSSFISRRKTHFLSFWDDLVILRCFVNFMLHAIRFRSQCYFLARWTHYTVIHPCWTGLSSDFCANPTGQGNNAPWSGI